MQDRITAESSLKGSQEIFGLLVDAVEDYAIFALDNDGNILTWNAGGQRLKGYLPADVIGKHFSIFYTPEDRNRKHPEEELEIAKKTGKYEEEGWRVKKDGSQFWANVVITALRDNTGKLRGFGKVTRDLTERRKAELFLKESEERFRLMVESVQDYAIFMLNPQGFITTWNRGAERTKGYKAAEIIGKHFSIFYGLTDIQNKKPEFELIEAAAKGRFEEEGWRLKKDGSQFWANVVITAVLDTNNKLVGYSKVTRDLTERKRAEENLKISFAELEKRVEQRTKDLSLAKASAEAAVASRDQFFSMASHELKTPLSALKMQTQLRKMSVLNGDFSDFKPQNLPALCDYDERQINRLCRLVDSMFDISRLTSGELVLHLDSVNLTELLKGICDMLAPQASESKNKISIVCPENLKGHWDATRLEQVLTNLILNACKYAPGSEIEIRVLQISEQVQISIRDFGPGIAPAEHSKVFDPFERLNVKTSTGLGLGLFIVKMIIEAHSGTVILESEVGKGANFIVRLPLDSRPMEEGL